MTVQMGVVVPTVPAMPRPIGDPFQSDFHLDGFLLVACDVQRERERFILEALGDPDSILAWLQIRFSQSLDERVKGSSTHAIRNAATWRIDGNTAGVLNFDTRACGLPILILSTEDESLFSLSLGLVIGIRAKDHRIDIEPAGERPGSL